MIKRADIGDLNSIYQLEQECFSDPLDKKMLLHDLENNPFAIYYVYLKDNETIGYIGAIVCENTQIINLCTKLKYQNQGVGSALIKELIDYCALQNVYNITLDVRPSNQKAIKLYEKFGFEKIHIRKKYYSNNEDCIVMERKILC